MGSLALSLHGFYKFCGPILLDAVYEYLDASDEVPSLNEESDHSDHDPGDGLSDAFDGILKILRKKRGKKAATHPRDEVPLLSTEISGGTGEDDLSMTSFQIEDLSDDDDDTSSMDFGDHMGPSKTRQRPSYPNVPAEPLGSPPDDSSSSDLPPATPKKPQKRELHAPHQKDPAEASGSFEDENIFKDPDLLHEDDGTRSSPDGDVYKSADDLSDLTETTDSRSREWSKYDVRVTYRRGDDTHFVSASDSSNSSQDTVLEMNEQLGQEAMDSLNQSPWLQQMLRKYADKK